ncbi:MAG: Ig-like domain-containing protein, partial [Verrucomicrobiota bacterium]
NNPPFAKITSPLLNAAFAAPAEITVNAEAFDADDSISRVQFLTNGIVFGERTNIPYSQTMSNVPPGHYQITAVPFDQTNASSASRPIDIFVHASGGTLSGSVAFPPAGVDLTAEGILDWDHWGFTAPTTVNRKAGVPLRINMNTIGTNVLQRYADNYTGYDWNDGTPTVNASGTKTGIFLPGITNGFQLSVPADTAPKTLKVYVGVYGGSGNFQAWLSDFSAPVFTDRSLTNAYGNSYAVYTLNYKAAANGQTLTLKYTADFTFDQDFGNVTLQAAALSGSVLTTLFKPTANSGSFIFSFGTDLGQTYPVYYTDSLGTTNWLFLTNVIGSGLNQTVIDGVTNPQRFYRIQTN